MAMIESRKMDFTESIYINITRMFLTVLGPWPHLKPFTRNIRASIAIGFICLSITPQFVKLFNSFDDIDMFTATLSPLSTALGTLTKFTTLVIHNEKLKSINDKINENWRTFRIKEEMDIMEKYLLQAKLYTKIYIVYIGVAAVPFFTMALMPVALDYVIPLNESRPRRTVYPADYYFIDEEDYFLVITFHMSMCGVTVLGMVIAADTIYLMYVQYICGLFAVIGNRLEFTMYKCNDATSSRDCQKNFCNRYVKECVQLHCTILWLVSVMESTFSFSCLIQLGVGALALSVTLVQIVVELGGVEAFRSVLFSVSQMIVLFYISYQGQTLIDHSSGTFDKIYAGLWYNVPTETQKLLLFMLHKMSKPCYLTAGKLFIYSMENFSMVVQNSMSYFMVLVSLR